MEKKTNIKYISKIVWLALVLSLAAALVTAHLYREKSAEHVEAAGQVESLSSDVVDLEAEISELTRQIEALENKVTDVQEDYTELQDEHSSLQSDYTELRSDYTELTADVSSVTDELSAKESELSTAVSDLEAKSRRITSLEKRLTRQMSRYDDAVTEKDQLSTEIADLEEQIALLEADIYRLRTAAAIQSAELKAAQAAQEAAERAAAEAAAAEPVWEPAPEPVTVPEPESLPAPEPEPEPEPEPVPAYIPSGEATVEELMRLLQYGAPMKWYRNANGSLYQAPAEFTAFGYCDLTTGETITYNADTVYYSASLIKAPYIYSVLLEVSEFEKTAQRDEEGNIVYGEGEEKYNLDEMWTFDPETMMEEGSGEIKAMPAGTQMTWKELFSYVLLWSDNVAWNQIMDRFGFGTFYSLVGQLGIQGTSSDFMDLSANDCLKFMKEIYQFFETGDRWAQFMKENMMKSKHNVMICASFPAGTVPHKYGWDTDSYHDMGIIYDEHPYLLVIMTDLHDGSQTDNAFVHSVVEMAKQIHAKRYGS